MLGASLCILQIPTFFRSLYTLKYLRRPADLRLQAAQTTIGDAASLAREDERMLGQRGLKLQRGLKPQSQVLATRAAPMSRVDPLHKPLLKNVHPLHRGQRRGRGVATGMEGIRKTGSLVSFATG